MYWVITIHEFSYRYSGQQCDDKDYKQHIVFHNKKTINYVLPKYHIIYDKIFQYEDLYPLHANG